MDHPELIHTYRYSWISRFGILLCLFPFGLYAQNTDAALTLEALDEETEAAELIEWLTDLQEHPIPVNTATVEELVRIPALTRPLAAAIVNFRTAFGPFESLNELQAVEGMTTTRFEAARPFLTLHTESVSDQQEPDPIRSRNRTTYTLIHRYSRRLDLGRGYADDTTRTTYLGSPERLYTRLQIQNRRLRINITADKDPGESFAWRPENHTYGYDFLSGHIALTNAGRLETLILGDYVALFGQGMVLWRGSGFGKGRAAASVGRPGGGLRPYGSTDENAFFRGLGARVALMPGLHADVFVSRRSLDASVEETETGTVFTTGLAPSGLHRTGSEQNKKDRQVETLSGGAVTWNSDRAEIGLSAYRTRFRTPFQAGQRPDQLYAFSGDARYMAGLFATLSVGSMTGYGEVARSGNGPFGGLGGVSMQLSNNIEAVASVRYYPRDFVSLHGRAFGERNGAPGNETGIYLGLEGRPRPAWRVAAYFDQYHFPWLRFNVPRPTHGYDGLTLLEYRPNRTGLIYVQFRHETKETGATFEDLWGRMVRGVEARSRQSLRLHAELVLGPHLRVRGRIEGTRFKQPGREADHGFLMYQDLRWRPRAALQFDLRLALFDTDSFDARVFAFENDVLYTLSNPSFSGRGRRTYVLVRFTPWRVFDLWFKYAETRYEDVRTVGSGLDEVEGNRLREIRLQMRVRW